MIVPAGAGVGSAIGFLRAPVAFEVVRSDQTRAARVRSRARPTRLLADDARGGRAPWCEPALRRGEPMLRVQTRLADLRYVGPGP